MGFKNITVLGEVSERQLNTLYSTALVLLQTNDDRGFGMPALEAAGHGTTFIIPQGQGVCALFKHKKDGFYTKEQDTKMINTYLATLLKNPQQAARMGRHAWEIVQADYSWEKHAKLLRALIA
jgi:glycosyltransferase involved in cell wall biosynthesis